MSNTKKATEKKPPTLDEIRKQVKPAESVVPVCVRADLVAEVQELELQAVEAEEEDQKNKRLGSTAKAPQLAKRIKDLEAEMRQYTYDFRFRAIKPRDWSDLLAKYPDETGRLRVDFYNRNFRAEAIAASCVEPEGMDDVEAVTAFLDELQAGQCDELFDGAWSVNQQAGKATNSYIASSILQSFEENSSTASRLASPAASS